jgi:16S rRNA (uracil1498-N3)-methyltransferase
MPTRPDTTCPRIYLNAALAEGVTAACTPGHAHYLGTVLRQAVGAAVRLFNGRDGEFAATIAYLRRDRLELEVGARTRAQAAEPDLWLVFSPLKRDATDLVVQKATELGVSALLPVFCARTNAARINDARLRAIAIEAAEQCERLTIPVLHPAVSLAEALGAWPTAPPIGRPRGRILAAAIERAAGLPPAQTVRAGGLLVGPEGGFAPRELDVMRETPFIQPVSLGPRILRAETAALAGLALLACQDW